MMKKICFVTTLATTIDSFILELSKYLHETGNFDISFICSPDEDFQKKVPEYIHLIPVAMKRGISLEGIKIIHKLKKIFKKEKFDLVQYSTPNAACYASVAAWLTRVPVRLYCQWGIVYVGFEGIKRKIFKLEEKMVCRLSTWIEPDSYGNLAFSHSEKLYPDEKGSVIWNGSASGVSFTKFDIAQKEAYRKEIKEKYKIDSKSFVFGFVGRVTKDKGINELFRAYKDVYESDSSVYLLLVGNSEKTDSIDSELYDWIKENPHVIFAGYTNEVEKYLSAMDCFVLPSYREGFGLGVVEAEAMGVPVIVTNIPGPTDAMENEVTGIIVEKKDVPSLTAAMNRMKTEDDLRQRFADNAVEFSHKFEQRQLFEYIKNDRLALMGMDANNENK